MKLKFLATAQAPDKYDIDGEIITAYHAGQVEQIDLSPLQEGGRFEGIELHELQLPPLQVIRDAQRQNGQLHVTLCQQAPSGHWRESDWIDAADYDLETIYIKNITKEETNGNADS